MLIILLVLSTFMLDLIDRCARVVAAAATALGGLTSVVNCAGVLQGGAFGTTSCNLENFSTSV
eukprot:m.906154 g.906154  ORF g.906154 m.906154 type:complete len:63 (-) comp23700_c0_seq65:3030-3218(-)